MRQSFADFPPSHALRNQPVLGLVMLGAVCVEINVNDIKHGKTGTVCICLFVVADRLIWSMTDRPNPWPESVI